MDHVSLSIGSLVIAKRATGVCRFGEAFASCYAAPEASHEPARIMRKGGPMKFAAIIEYGADKDRLKATHAAHRTYLRTFLENGQLRAAGPFADDAGVLWILDADTAEAAEAIVKGDPFGAAGVITSWKVRPVAYWSAQEAKGAR